MKLTNRDEKIIDYIDINKGATIIQVQKSFFPSYKSCADRLKTLSDNGFLKVDIQPSLGLKVYYTKKMPSYHSLIINDISILLKDKYKFMQREYKIKKYYVDAIFILKDNSIIVTEVEIFNRTSDKKIKEVLEALKETKVKVEYWIVSKRTPQQPNKNVRYVKI
jgi:hypothetical protein